MASYGQSITVVYYAWNTSTGAYTTGDVANHTLKLLKDGSEASPSNSPAEVDATNMPGAYSLVLTTAECQHNCVVLGGKSSTANVILIGITVAFEQLPTATPGASGGVLIAGTNAATTISSLTLNGAAASGATPATAGLIVTGGAASTSVGGTSATAISLTGGAGAASTNGASAGMTVSAGGTTTVSGADAATYNATGNGNGITFTHAGSGKDLNAQTTNALQVNATAINSVSASSVTTINANVGTTQPTNFTGTSGSALIQCDTRDFLGHAVVLDGNNYPGVNLVDIAGSAVSTSTAQLGVNAVNWGGTAVGTLPPDAVFLRNGTAQAGGSTSITLDSGASATSNLYNNAVIFIRSGTGTGQTNIISAYNGSTKVATVSNSWATNPDNTSVFTIAGFGPVIASVSGTVTANVTQWNGSAVSAPNVSGVPVVDLGYVNGSAVSTSSAQLGVNAVNIGGQAAQLDANNLLKVDVVDIAGTASAGTPGYVAPDWSAVNAPTATVNLTGTTISVSQAIASVSGSVASVTNPVSTTSNRKKGTGATFTFTMTNSATGTDQPSLTVAAVISKDGGAFASTINAVTEIANGWYSITLTSGEMNANNIALQMTATGANTRDISIQTTP